MFLQAGAQTDFHATDDCAANTADSIVTIAVTDIITQHNESLGDNTRVGVGGLLVGPDASSFPYASDKQHNKASTDKKYDTTKYKRTALFPLAAASN